MKGVITSLLTTLYGDVTQRKLSDIIQAQPHHMHWVSLQSGLPHALRAVLFAIVERHAGFQADHPKSLFFMLREHLEPLHMPGGMSWKTFCNHRSELVRLGLLDLVWRAPNQWGSFSMWRVNYNTLFLSIPRAQRRTGEPKYIMVDIADYDFAADAADEEHEDDILAEIAASEAVPAGVTPEVAIAALMEAKGLDNQSMGDGSSNVAVAEPPKASAASTATRRQRGSRRQTCTCSCTCGSERITAGNGSRKGAGNRKQSAARKAPVVADIQPSDNTQTDEQSQPPAEPTEWELAVRRDIKKELSIDLADEDMQRFKDIETLWNQQWHTKGTIDHHFLTYAIQRTRETAPDRPIGYVLAILESTVRKGYTEDGGSAYRQPDRGKIVHEDTETAAVAAAADDSAVDIEDLDEEQLRAAIEQCLDEPVRIQRMVDRFASAMEKAEKDQDAERLAFAKDQVHYWESKRASSEDDLAQLKARLAEITGGDAVNKDVPPVTDESALVEAPNSKAEADADEIVDGNTSTPQNSPPTGDNRQAGLSRTQRRKLKRVLRRKKNKKRK